VAFPFGDAFDAEGLDGQGLCAILNGGTLLLVFHRCPRTPQDPGLKTSSCSLRRHDPDQVPRVSPSRGRLSALLGSPFGGRGVCIRRFGEARLNLERRNSANVLEGRK
jgi:hypothetical protein